MSGIFLSYRRDDASGWAGRLYEHLVRDWGIDHVFMDIDTIAPGEDFRKAIARTMDACDVVMVVIGPSWLEVRDQAGRRRLDQAGDTHRAEVVAALAADVRVIPVLVGGAMMPEPSELPGPMQDLAYRNAAIVEDRRFASDVDALDRRLRTAMAAGDRLAPQESSSLPGATTPEPSPRPSSTVTTLPDPTTWTLLGLGTFLVLVWGVLMPRGWHNEFWGIRVVAGLVLLAGVAAGAATRRWSWVLAAGAAGLAGFVLWGLQLLSTHGSEASELVSPGGQGDGFANAATYLGAVLVLVAGRRATHAVHGAGSPGGPGPARSAHGT